MSVWLIVRDPDSVSVAYEHVMQMLAWRRQPGEPASGTVIDGIWVSASMAAQPPTILTARDGSGEERRLRVCETTGVDGVWWLCRIEPVEPGLALSRGAIIDALLMATAKTLNQPPERLVPILSTQAGDVKTHALTLIQRKDRH